MRILTVSPYRRGHGAYERQRRIARALAADGHEVLWLAPGIDNPGSEQLLTVSEGGRLGPLGWVLGVRKAIERHADTIGKLDGVFAVSEYDALGCLLHPLTARVPLLFFQRGDTIECEGFHARHATRLARRLKSRLLLTFYPLVQRFVMRRVSGVVVQGGFLGDLLKARWSDMTCPVIVLPNDCRFEWSLEEGAELADTISAFRGEGLLIGLVAQAFWAGKGFDLFFEALGLLKDCPDIRAVILGYGEDEALIRKTIAEMGLTERVLFPGRANAARRVMSLFDTMVVPTRFMDACPNVVMEAMDVGVAILASDIPAHRAQLNAPELLFPNGDAQALADGIRRLRDPKWLQRNRDLVAERRQIFDFDWDARVAALFDDFFGGKTKGFSISDTVQTRKA